MQPEQLLHVSHELSQLMLHFHGHVLVGRCKPNKPATTEKLRKLGVLQWQLDADKHEQDPKLKAIRADRNYSYQVRPNGTSVTQNAFYALCFLVQHLQLL